MLFGEYLLSTKYMGSINAKALKVKLCSTDYIREFVETNHYSHSINGVKISYCFSVTYKDRLVGAVIFGAMSTTAWKRFADSENKVIELRRLVLLDEAGRCSESRVISKCIKLVKRADRDLEVIVSYADPLYGHTGIIYKASNFEYLGLGNKDKGYLDPETGKTYHSRALRTKYKGEYKPFVKRLREKLEQGLLTPITLPPKHCYVYKLHDRKSLHFRPEEGGV